MAVFCIRNMIHLNKTKLALTYVVNSIRSNSIQACELVFEDYGDPVKVVHSKQVDVPKPEGYDVLVKMLAAPVNPADINTIQGKYPAKITLPAIPGNEGVGEILAVGELVKSLQVGDRVIPLLSNTGTWKTHLTIHSDILYKVPEQLGIAEAATFTVNPCSAYRMLEDFMDLAPGDTVIQNGGNSAVGQNVIQICKARNINTVSIVRNRPEINELKTFLKNLGGTEVFTEEEIRTYKFDSKLKKPKLALNCVGGKNALEIVRHLDRNGIMVTYGGMSREPLTVPVSALIFKNIQFVGFWMTQWTRDHFDSEARWRMFSELIDMMLRKQITAPVHKMIPFKDYREALQKTLSITGFTGQKYILDLTK